IVTTPGAAGGAGVVAGRAPQPAARPATARAAARARRAFALRVVIDDHDRPVAREVEARLPRSVPNWPRNGVVQPMGSAGTVGVVTVGTVTGGSDGTVTEIWSRPAVTVATWPGPRSTGPMVAWPFGPVFTTVPSGRSRPLVPSTCEPSGRTTRVSWEAASWSRRWVASWPNQPARAPASTTAAIE